jgi:hypothetical protein
MVRQLILLESLLLIVMVRLVLLGFSMYVPEIPNRYCTRLTSCSK